MGHPTSSQNEKSNLPLKTDAARVTIALDDATRNDPTMWNGVVEKLKAHGLEVSRELNVIGIVAGSVPSLSIDAIKGEAHVVSVVNEERKTIQ